MDHDRTSSAPPDVPPPGVPPRIDVEDGRGPADTRSGSGSGTTERVGWGLALVAVGTLWLLSVAGVAIRWELIVPIGLIVVGVLVLASPRGHGGGPIGLGIVLLVLAAATATVPTTLPISVGERTHTITAVTDLDEGYTLGAGQLELDLRGLDPADLPAMAQQLRAQVIFGELTVRLPEGVRLTGDAQAVFGEVERFGRSTGGVNARTDLAEGDDPAPGQRALDLDLRVIFGRIEVDR